MMAAGMNFGMGLIFVLPVRTAGAVGLNFNDPANSSLLALLTGDQFGGTSPPAPPGAFDFSDPAQSGVASLLFGDEAP